MKIHKIRSNLRWFQKFVWKPNKLCKQILCYKKVNNEITILNLGILASHMWLDRNILLYCSTPFPSLLSKSPFHNNMVTILTKFCHHKHRQLSWYLIEDRRYSKSGFDLHILIALGGISRLLTFTSVFIVELW